jgi:hypothetical protein
MKGAESAASVPVLPGDVNADKPSLVLAGSLDAATPETSNISLSL